jgi:hypothetical protein
MLQPFARSFHPSAMMTRFVAKPLWRGRPCFVSRYAGLAALHAAIAFVVLPSPRSGLLSAQAVAPAPSAALTPAQWLADLRFMMEDLPRVHKNLYHTTSKAKFDSAATTLSAQIPRMSRDEIIMGMMRIVALASDGHTNIYPTRDRAIGFHSLPVAMYFFKDGLYIRAAEIGDAHVVGARVLKIGSVTAQQAYERVRPYIGCDNEMDALFFAPQLLAMPEVLHALGLSASADSARFEVEVDGVRRSVWLRADQLIAPRPGDTDDSWRPRNGWIDAREAATTATPLWLRQPPDTVLWWFTQIPGQHAAYVQVNQVRDGDSTTLEQFSDRLMTFIDTARIDRLVIDLRLNRGGNGELRLPLVRSLLRTPKVNTQGKLFVLMGRSTFSAAQFLLDDLQKYSMALFVGEPSGSKGNTYGDSRQIKLPNSGITVRASVYYWQDWSPFVTRQWTAPDIAAEMTFADYRANKDPALDAALSYVPAKSLDVRMREAMQINDTVSAQAQFRSYMADPKHAYVDGLAVLDDVGRYFYNRKDYLRSASIFALAELEYPSVLDTHLDAATLYHQINRPDLERISLTRALQISPGNAQALTRLSDLDTHVPRDKQ